MLTWGDGVSDIDLDELLAFHRAHGKLATVTAVRPPARFGHLELDGDRVAEFSEKPQLGEGWINGAFFVLEPEVFDYIDGDDTQWEREPLERLARDGQLMAYRHDVFWQCMDTLRDKKLLEELWTNGAPWRTVDVTMRVLVTGHDGYIGMRARAAARRRPATRWSGSTATSTTAAPSAPTPRRRPGAAQGHPRRRRSQHLEGFDAVIHLAAISNDPLGDLDPGDDLRHQPPRGGAARASWRRRPASQRFLFSSSCSLYGAAGDDFLDENAGVQPGDALRPVEGAGRAGHARSWPTTTSARPTCAARRPTASRRGCAATSSSTTSSATPSRPARC